MTQTVHALYPVLLASVDVGLAGLLYLIAPPIGVLMAVVGTLVACALVHRTVSHLNAAVRPGPIDGP